MSTPDLAPGAPSRELLIDAVAFGEGTPTSGTITFMLPCDLRILSTGQILTAGSITVPLTDGGGTIRVPSVSSAVTDDAGDQWVIIVKKSWEKKPYGIRVPAGSGTIALGDIAPARPLKGRELQWAISSATMTVTQVSPTTPASGTVSVSGGNLDFRVSIPRGEKGDPGTAQISNVTGLQAALDAKARKEPLILAGENLNDVIDDGPYIQPSTSTASAALNYPANSAGAARAGHLEVSSGASNILVRQRFTTFNGGETYWRTRYSGTWYPWERSFRASEAAPMLAQLAALTYKSGRIDITSRLDPAPVSGKLWIERRGGMVWLQEDNLVLTNTTFAERVYSNVIPDGFQINAPAEIPTAPRLGTEATDVQTNIRTYNHVLAFYRVTGGAAVRGLSSWPTDQPIPTQLP